MSRDQRLLMIVAGQASFGELALGCYDLARSPDARYAYRRFAAAAALLRLALADDDRLTLRTRPRRWVGKNPWLLVAVLFLAAFFEWRTYSLPVLVDWIRTVGHRCGLWR